MLFAPWNVIIAQKLTKFIQIEQVIRNRFWYEKSGVLFFQNFWRFGTWSRKAIYANFINFLIYFDNSKYKTHLQLSSFSTRLSLARADARAYIKIGIFRKYALKNAKFMLSIFFMAIFWRANVSARAVDFRFEKFDKGYHPHENGQCINS